MTEDVAKKAGELYRRKSELTQAMSNAFNSTIKSVTYSQNGVGWYFGYGGRLTIDMGFCEADLKEWVIMKIKNELSKVDIELSKLSC